MARGLFGLGVSDLLIPKIRPRSFYPFSYFLGGKESISHQSNLFHQSYLIVEEALFGDFPLVVPGSDRTKLYVKPLVRGRDCLPVRHLHRPLHRAGEISDRASMIPLRQEDLVRSVDQVIIRKGFEEFNSF